MISRIPKPLLFLISFLLGLGLYWPSMNGQPVWDDMSYLFRYDVIVGDFPYLTIWKEFGWPLSVSTHKFLFGFWKNDYLNYHLLNFIVHFINSILILNIAEKLKLPFARLLFIFFFLHPANVISVSWMIQLKTLMCLFFALLSFQALLKAESNKKWFLLSWILFALSLISKSASIPLPFFYFFFLKKKVARKQLLWLVPFFILSMVSSWKTLSSPVTNAAVKGMESKTQGTVQEKFKPIDAEPAAKPQVKNKVNNEPEAPEIHPGGGDQKMDVWEILINRAENFIAMSHYYFWQTLLPIENAPVKGLKYEGPGAIEYIHFIFIILVVLININTSVSLYLLMAHLMLLPFLGIFPAPYMNLTWVSDQHLYLALPLFICFWLSLLGRWKMKYAPLLPLFIIPIYIYKVLVTTPYYKNDIDFYQASLDADALNVPIAYNLAMAYLQVGNVNQAMNITSTMVSMSQVAPEVFKNKYFSYIYLLDLKLHQMDFNKEHHED
jgi:hypothetical protein